MDSKKDIAKFVVQVLLSILTAVATALGVTSCMAAAKAIDPPQGSFVAMLVD